MHIFRKKILPFLCCIIALPATAQEVQEMVTDTATVATDSVAINQKTETGGQDSVIEYTSAAQMADDIIKEAKKYLGRPYHYGANGPSSFDCTGFTCYVFKKFGIHLSRSSSAQANDGVTVRGGFKNLQKGDIIVMGGRRSTKSPGHVGIFIEYAPDKQSFTFIHAAVHGGISISRSTESYYKPRLIRAQRVIPTFEPIAIVHDTLLLNTDSVMVEPFVVASQESGKDTLTLSANDKRIILLENGTWYYVDTLGHLTQPADAHRLVLQGNGGWCEEAATPVVVSTPKPTTTSTPAANNSPKPSASSQQSTYHTVKKGDTLSAIARRYGTSVSKICSLNKIKADTTLQIGKKLRVK